MTLNKLPEASENTLLFVSLIVCLSKAPENETSRQVYLKLDSGGHVGNEDDNESDKEEDQVFKNHNEDKLWQGLGFKFYTGTTFSPMMIQYSRVKSYTQLQAKS